MKLRLFIALFAAASLWAFCTQPAVASAGSVLGIHILAPDQASQANQLLTSPATSDTSTPNDDWHAVTIPLTLDDLQKPGDWQKFFRYAAAHHLQPIVRLTSRFDNGAWQIPTYKDIVDEITFLSALDWPTNHLPIIVFNEVNHADEWGNSIDPASYAQILRFTSNWAKSEPKNYQVLPAAMDLAAGKTTGTTPALAYLDQMLAADPQIFDFIDAWNSHSYPNPGFSGPANATGLHSIRGFADELAYIKQKTGRDLQTYITETGWAENAATARNLDAYYQYAASQVWSDPRVIAVTPFVLQGAPGPFAAFTFLDQNGQPTRQYDAYQRALALLEKK